MSKTVTLRGKALDAKAGAIVLVDGDRAVYIEGLSGWPNEAYGKRVAVTGVLVRKKFIPDPVNEAGEICQGARGSQDVLEEAQWTVEGP